MRIVSYDFIALVVVLLNILTFIYIIKDRKMQGSKRTAVWCLINFCFPVIGFIAYCLGSKVLENRKM